MHIAIIDDEKILSAGIERKLIQNHYNVTVLNSFAQYKSTKLQNIDLYLVDISLGDGSGFDIIRSLKQDSKTQDVPILLMSGHDDVPTKVEWLDIGADDYIVKPFDPEELLARVRSLLRRKDTPVKKTIITYKEYSYDLTKREMYLGQESIALTKKERQILEMFLSKQNTLIEKEQIIRTLWGKDQSGVTDNTLNVTMCNLRRKLGDEFELETKIGEGYILKSAD